MLRATQLQTLVNTDLVDSTQLVEHFGDHRAAEVLRRHDQIVRQLLTAHEGRESDRTDGFMLLFDRPISAVLFAIAYHQALAQIQHAPMLAARVGIHLGEVELWENEPGDVSRGARPVEIEGLALSTVARIASMAGPGQTLLTRAASDLARRSSVGIDRPGPRLYWRSHGYFRFKGLSDPIEVFEVGGEPLDPQQVLRDTDKTHRVGPDGRQSLVVLPFANLSPDGEADYICDGLVDEIITRLSPLKDLRVIARTSAMQLKDRQDDKLLANELGVQCALKGSLRKAGDNLRVTARLTRVDSEELLWAHSFSGTLGSIFEVQQSIATSVVEALKIKINVAQAAKMAERPIPNVKAYEYYLRARAQIYTYTAEGMAKALSYLSTGEAILGANPQLTAAIGYVHWQLHNAGIDPHPKNLIEARKCAQKLFALDPVSPDAFRLLGLINMRELGDIQDTVRYLKRSLDANPNDTDTLLWLSLMYGFAGRTSSGYALAERLLSLDPLATLPLIVPGFLAMLDGDLDRACRGLLRSHEQNPGNPITALSYAQALAMAGRREDACEVFASLERSVAGSFFAGLSRFYIHSLRGEKAHAHDAVTAAMDETAASDLQHSWNMAQCYALIGDHENAIQWLENAIRFGFWNYPLFTESDPLLASLREDDRFRTLMDQVRGKWIYFEV